MIKIFGINGCIRCEKAKNFFVANNIDFTFININTTKITRKDILDMFLCAPNGFDDFISKNSILWKTNIKQQYNKLMLNDFINLLIENYQVFSRPIIIEYDSTNTPRRLMVGYSKNDIEIFKNKILENYFAKFDCDFQHDECHIITDFNLKSCKNK